MASWSSVNDFLVEVDTTSLPPRLQRERAVTQTLIIQQRKKWFPSYEQTSLQPKRHTTVNADGSLARRSSCVGFRLKTYTDTIDTLKQKLEAPISSHWDPMYMLTSRPGARIPLRVLQNESDRGGKEVPNHNQNVSRRPSRADSCSSVLLDDGVYNIGHQFYESQVRREALGGFGKPYSSRGWAVCPWGAEGRLRGDDSYSGSWSSCR